MESTTRPIRLRDDQWPQLSQASWDVAIKQGVSTQKIGTWDLGNSNCSTGFWYVYDYYVLGSL